MTSPSTISDSTAGAEMHGLATKLFPICRSLTGEGVRRTLSILQELIPFSDLITRAGGILPTGYPDGASFIREDLGRIDIDLETALAIPESVSDVLLRPGDILNIPTYSPTVEVQGAVISPVTVLYREGEDLDYYIANAGGYREDADEDRVSVRFANGQAETREKVLLLWYSSPTPGPGSEITVPAVVPDTGPSIYEVLTPLVGMMGTVTALIVAVMR